jgi:hypothetical protein
MQPTQKNKIRLLPYGMSDFATIRKENRYYVDKTMIANIHPPTAK